MTFHTPIFSPKQKLSIQESNSRFNIWEGSVRSGKSYSMDWRFLKELKDGPQGAYLICGKSEHTIIKNIIDPLQDITGGIIRYKRGVGEFNLFGKKVYAVGANDERAEGKIRGNTYAGALVDEVTILPENFFKQLMIRLSVQGSKVFCSTNPDSPMHWFKTGYIDRALELDMKIFKFTLEDNPSLTDEYKANIRKEYQGLWYKRFILGEWVLAEGSIYDFFEDRKS